MVCTLVIMACTSITGLRKKIAPRLVQCWEVPVKIVRDYGESWDPWRLGYCVHRNNYSNEC